MIELKIGQLLDSIETLKQLSGEPLKARVAFIVARIIKETDAEVTNYNETRTNLINKYGKKNEDGSLAVDAQNNVQFDPADAPAFNTELNELLNTTITLTADKIKMDDLENLEFTPAEILTLEPFIEE